MAAEEFGCCFCREIKIVRGMTKRKRTIMPIDIADFFMLVA
jgi:hypothetical protein